MQLPPGPRAPTAWQTLGWMAQPGGFMRRLHRRFGDPVTIRTYWTEEPMVLFSQPDAVREIFRLDPAIAPAGRSWEFLRPFAGQHSILLLDGDEHLHERRLLQAPFHGERMRALTPAVAELARQELSGWHGRVVALERMRALTLEIILRVVFGAAGDDDAARLRGVVESALATVRSMPQILGMVLIQRDLGPQSPWGRFRAAVERFDEVLFELLARRRADPGSGAGAGSESGAALSSGSGAGAGSGSGAGSSSGSGAGSGSGSVLSLLLEQRDERGNPPSDRQVRDQLVALLVGGHDSSAASLAWAFERLARHPEVHARLRDGDPAYLDAVVKEVLRARPALTIAPRLLLEPARIAGYDLPAGIQVAACLWLAMRREDLWPQASAFAPERWLRGPQPNPMSWIPYGGGVRRCAGSPFAEMEMREVLKAASVLKLQPARARPERSRRSMLVVVPNRGGELIVG
jgi:cytochrome P450 family 135